jgi:hypothetical protein
MTTLTEHLRSILYLTGLLLIMGSLPDTAAADTIYKTVDAQGNITFSNTPPPEGANAQQIDLPPGPTPAEEQQGQQQEQQLENMANDLGNSDNAGAPQAEQPVPPTTESPQSTDDVDDEQGTAVVEDGYLGDRTRNERIRDRVDDMKEVRPGPAAISHPGAHVR